jgi:hypothetical protein
VTKEAEESGGKEERGGGGGQSAMAAPPGAQGRRQGYREAGGLGKEKAI